MIGKYRPHHILEVVLLVITLAALPVRNLWADEDSKYLDAVREFADNVLKYGRDTYGPKHTPLFVDGLNIHTHEPVKWISPEGERWILSNLASQQNLFRTLDGLTKITGDSKYRQAAMDAIKYAFDNLRSPNGLLYWGSDQAYDAAADKPCGGGLHEFKGFYPYYKLMWEVNPQATKRFIEAFWSAHILNWSNLDMNRCALLSEPLEVPWKHEYEGGPVFFESWGFSPINTGGDLCYAAAMLNMLLGEREPLVWGKRLVHRYIETRNPKTGFSYPVFTVMRGWRIQVPSNDEILSKLGPMPFIFRGDANRALFECHFGYDTPTPGTFLNPLSAVWICQLMLGDLLGDQGTEFTQWAIEELTAWGKVAYRSRDNVFIPMCLDGTSLEGYVCKEDGPLGFKGTTLEPVAAGTTDFWAYALAYCQTDNEFMWEMTRNIALGNTYGDLGISATEESRLNLQTDLTDPYVIIVFLELYRKTNKRVFLEMARRIGDNVLTHRFHGGFFAPERHTFTKFDSIDSLALLHLHTALISNKSESIPRIWPGTSFFESLYRSKDPIDDNQLIYSLKDVSEPPISLQEAAAGGNVEAVKSMIAQGIDVDGREDGFHKTALHRAAISGQKEVAELLLDKGADIDARDYYLTSALHYSLENDRKEIAGLLIDRGADVNVRNGRGETPLHSAVENDRKEIAELLIAHDADVNAKDDQGRTPIDLAISQGRKEIAKLLLSKSDDVSLHTAAYFGDLQRVEKFIDDGVSVDAKDQRDQTALHYAAKAAQIAVAKLLIANGADVNAGEWTPLQEAAYYSKEMVELLIAKGANINEGGWSPLHSALDAERFDIVELLLAKGADVNIKDGKGRTPLHIAAWYAAGKNPKIVELLLSKGADINAKDNNGETALSYAIEHGHTEIVELLRRHGAKE